MAAYVPARRVGRKPYRRWLATLRFDHPAVQPVRPDYIHCVHDAEARVGQLRRQIAERAPSWSMAPVVAALRAMRGTVFLVAEEVGDFSRFASPVN
jgi:transposase